MAIHIPQNFYRQTVAQDWATGTGNFYVSVKPTVSEGYMTISPSSSTLREIVYFSATGTDGTGDYVTISDAGDRGMGGTTEQTHIIGETVRMNVSAETIQEISDDIDAIVAAGAPDATTTTKGLSVIPVFESTTGTTHSLTTIADEKVMVWAKGDVSSIGTNTTTIVLQYNGVTKDTITMRSSSSSNNPIGTFSLMYTETPGAATQNVTVSKSGGAGTVGNVVIIVLKIRTP